MYTATDITATKTTSIVVVWLATRTPMAMPPPIATGKNTAVRAFRQAGLPSPRAIEPIMAVIVPSSIAIRVPCGPRWATCP